MSSKKKNTSAITICIQELTEDGSQMDFGAIKGDDLRFLHQAFITDTISSALQVNNADLRLYYIDDPEREHLVQIVTEYLTSKLTSKKREEFEKRFSAYKLPRERWGVRMGKIFEDSFKQGYENVLLVGSRTPTITSTMFKTALRMLQKSDAVFGPTPEGRYYIVGQSGSYHVSLSDFDWKSPSIYSEVASAFTNKQLSWSELEIWYAVEKVEELELMVRDINQYRFDGDEITGRETELVMKRLLTKLEL